MSDWAERLRVQGIAAQFHAAKRESYSCWMSMSFVLGMRGTPHPSLVSRWQAATGAAERWALEWHAAQPPRPGP